MADLVKEEGTDAISSDKAKADTDQSIGKCGWCGKSLKNSDNPIKAPQTGNLYCDDACITRTRNGE